MGFATYMDTFAKDIDAMENLTDHKAKVKVIVVDMTSTKTK